MSKKSITARLGGGLGYGKIHDSLLLIFPLFLAYELGLLLADGSNGVDFVSRTLFELVDENRSHFLFVQLGLAVAFLGYLVTSAQGAKLSFDRVMPMLLESAIYALTLGTLIIFVMDRLLGIEVLSVGTPEPRSVALTTEALGRVVVIALGAGVFEEIVFRLILMGLGGAALTWFGLKQGYAIWCAVVVSSVLFSWAHHVGPAGEAFDIAVFVYRLLAGLIFAAIFYFRSLAHAVYTHFLYDLYVLGMAT